MVAKECEKCVFFELKKDDEGEYGFCEYCNDLINLDYQGNCDCSFYEDGD